MTQAAILLLSLTTAGPSAGQVVSGPGLRPGQKIPRGQVVKAPARGAAVALLTTGGCLVRLAAGAAVALGAPADQTRCSSVRVVRGRVRLFAPKKKGAGNALAVLVGKHRVTLSGEAFARHDGVTGICMNRGTARLTSPLPSPRPPSPTGTARPQSPAPTPRPTGPAGAAPPVTTPPKPSLAGKGQCLWLTAGGATVGQYPDAAATRDRQITADHYAFASPAVRVTVDLKKEVASLAVSVHGGSSGGSDVEGGGQSMCLETGSESSAADLGSSGVDITKPPPPTQLRLHITLTRTQ